MSEKEMDVSLKPKWIEWLKTAGLPTKRQVHLAISLVASVLIVAQMVLIWAFLWVENAQVLPNLWVAPLVWLGALGGMWVTMDWLFTVYFRTRHALGFPTHANYI